MHRGKTPFHVIARWRKSVKEAQISALKALKRKPSAGFIDAVSSELASAATDLFGSSTFEAVTNVPCGHSGPRCLSALLAERTAQILGVAYRPAFAVLEKSGSSHPATNAKRPRMRLKDRLECPVLLIDDVATSGSHIDEAAQLLKKTAPAVLSMAWISN
jgi:predicted amidophosphoribosyltransferase